MRRRVHSRGDRLQARRRRREGSLDRVLARGAHRGRGGCDRRRRCGHERAADGHRRLPARGRDPVRPRPHHRAVRCGRYGNGRALRHTRIVGRRPGRRGGRRSHGARRRGWRRARIDLRRRLRRHGRRGERRQEALRVAVPLGIGGQTNAELHVGGCVFGRAARVDDPNPLALGDGGARRDERRAEVQERHRVPIARLDRHRQAVRGDPSHERDRAGAGGQHGIARRALDVDASVLPGRERVVLGEEEAAQHRAGDRPRPRARRRGNHQRGYGDRHEEVKNRWVSLPSLQTEGKVAGVAAVVKSAYSDRR